MGGAGEVLDGLLGRGAVELLQEEPDAALAERLKAAAGRSRVGQPVGVEQDAAGGKRGVADLELGDLRRDAERMPRLQMPERLPVVQRDRRRMARRRPCQRHVGLDHDAQHRDELRRRAVLVHELRVDRPQDRRRIVEVGRAGGHHRAHEHRAPRCREPLADDVADHEHGGAVRASATW